MNMKPISTFTLLAAVLALAVTTRLSLQAQAPDSAAQAKQNLVPDSRVLPPRPSRPPPTPAAVPDSSQVSTQEFRFNGGSFADFVDKLRATYGSNALELLDLDIPEGTLPARIPKMRFPMRDTDIRSAFFIYNSTSEAGDWYLGKWIYSPKLVLPNDDNRLRTLFFFPPTLANPTNPANTGGIAVRAFDIGKLTPENRARLRDVLEIEGDRLREDVRRGRFPRQDPADASGRISFHEGAGLLVASGGKTYVELVASLVDVFDQTRTPFGGQYKP